MSVLSTAERIGMTRGREMGLREGIEKGKAERLRQAICDILELKFAAGGVKLFYHVDKMVSVDELEELRVRVKKARTIEDAEAFVKSSGKSEYALSLLLLFCQETSRQLT